MTGDTADEPQAGTLPPNRARSVGRLPETTNAYA